MGFDWCEGGQKECGSVGPIICKQKLAYVQWAVDERIWRRTCYILSAPRYNIRLCTTYPILRFESRRPSPPFHLRDHGAHRQGVPIRHTRSRIHRQGVPHLHTRPISPFHLSPSLSSRTPCPPLTTTPRTPRPGASSLKNRTDCRRPASSSASSSSRLLPGWGRTTKRCLPSP